MSNRCNRRAHLGACMVIAAASLAGGPALAFGHDGNWPCVQRKVEHLSWGQMWDGPHLPEVSNWRQDPELAALVPLLTARAIPVEDLAGPVAAIAATGQETRNARLTRLFAGAFEQIDNERYRIIGGIGRFAEKQSGLSDQIDAKRARVLELRAKAEATGDNDVYDAVEELEDEVFWDTRIYQDRRRSITYICESPVLLEKRAFAVAHMIMGLLDPE